MGLFSAVLLAPLAPVRAIGWVSEQLLAEAERVQAEQWRADLRELELQLQNGVITEEQFDRYEEDLWGRHPGSSVEGGRR